MADVITRMRVDSSGYDNKIKRAQQNLLSFEQQCRATKQSMNTLSKENLEYVKSIGNMSTVSANTRGKINELTNAFTELSMQYKRLSDEEKKGDFGKALTSSLDQLKTRITDTKAQLSDVASSLGDVGSDGVNLQSVLDQLGGKLGINTSLLNGLSAGTVGATAAIGAMVTTTLAATKAFADYNSELSMQGQVTTVTTGLQGPEADRMTDAARSIAEVYGTDFREVINAANTLMTQFGQTGEQSIQLIRDGMQGMIMGDGPKLLSMIQQYAPSFRDAGISASRLVAIIQNSEGGIFTDQNMNAIVMGIKNIRLMTNQTSEALAKMGIDGAEMTRKLNDGSMTIFEALGQVSDAIERTGSGSQAAGEVMQYVFGRQGAAAGTKLGEAIATLNTNLEETKKQTGELGQSYADLEQANERLNTAIRDAFGYDGWQTMATGIKTELVGALSSVLELVGEIKNSVVGELAGTIFDAMASGIKRNINLARTLLIMLNNITGRGSAGNVGDAANHGAALGSAMTLVHARPAGQDKSDPTKIDPPQPPRLKSPKPPKPEESTVIGGLKGLKELDGETLHVTESMKSLREQLSGYRRAAENADNPMDYARAQQGIADTQAKIKAQPMALRLGISTESMLDITNGAADAAEQLRQQIEADLKENPIVVPVETGGASKLPKIGRETMEAWQAASSAVSNVGSALQSIEDPGAKVAGIVAQAVANIALGFAQAAASPATGAAGVFGWIAAATAGLATMVATITSIKSVTSGNYAQGGVIPGNSYSGDNLLASVNSGEVILNAAQTNNLASALQGDTGPLMSPSHISGEQIYVVLNRYTRRTGRGELVTWK